MQVIAYLRARPLAVMAPAAVAGVVMSAHVPARWPVAAAVVVGALAVLAVALLLRRGAMAGVLAVGAALGFARHEREEYVPPSDVGWAAPPDERVHVRGRVAERPRLYRDRESALEETDERHAERASGAFALDLVAIDELPGVTGRVRVQFYDRVVELIGGEELALTGKLRAPRVRTNPGGSDRRARLRREGVGAVLVVGEKDEWTVARAAPVASFRTVLERVRDAVRGAFRRHARPEAAALMSALIIGSRENLPEDLVASLQRSGTAHFLAISGQNLAIVLGLVAVLFTLAGVRGPPQHALIIVVLFAYTALSGFQVSVVRAFLMAALWLGAHLAWRRSDSFNALCAAAVAIVLTDPGQVFEPGFQLSFLAVLGILFVAPVFHEFVASEPARGLPARIWSWTRGVLAISMAAWLATAPVVLAHFNLLTPVILLANLVLVPLMLVEIGAGIALLALAPVVPPLADAIGWFAGLTLDAIAGSSALLTRLPGSYLFVPALPGWGVALYYGALALWSAWARWRPGGVRPWLCALLALAMGLPGIGRSRPDGLFAAMLDVGRGSALYVEWPDGRNLVFDCGSMTHRDAGATVVAPYLWSRGVRRVDTLVLSHPDADHVNGARSLIERMRVRRLVVTRAFDEGFVAEMGARGLEVITVERTGAEPALLAPGLEVLGPPVWEKYGRDVPANETSIVLRIDGALLCTGDIGERGSMELVPMGGRLATPVFVVPHHGKRHGLHRALAAAVAPRAALVSAPEGFFSPEVVEHLEGTCRVFRTGRDGCVELTIRGNDVEVQTYLER